MNPVDDIGRCSAPDCDISEAIVLLRDQLLIDCIPSCDKTKGCRVVFGKMYAMMVLAINEAQSRQ